MDLEDLLILIHDFLLEEADVKGSHLEEYIVKPKIVDGEVAGFILTTIESNYRDSFDEFEIICREISKP